MDSILEYILVWKLKLKENQGTIQIERYIVSETILMTKSMLEALVKA